MNKTERLILETLKIIQENQWNLAHSLALTSNGINSECHLSTNSEEIKETLAPKETKELPYAKSLEEKGCKDCMVLHSPENCPSKKGSVLHNKKKVGGK